jgi:hypothetical protein
METVETIKKAKSGEGLIAVLWKSNDTIRGIIAEKNRRIAELERENRRLSSIIMDNYSLEAIQGVK